LGYAYLDLHCGKSFSNQRVYHARSRSPWPSHVLYSRATDTRNHRRKRGVRGVPDTRLSGPPQQARIPCRLEKLRPSGPNLGARRTRHQRERSNSRLPHQLSSTTFIQGPDTNASQELGIRKGMYCQDLVEGALSGMDFGLTSELNVIGSGGGAGIVMETGLFIVCASAGRSPASNSTQFTQFVLIAL
jgi:hypothetical protein